MGPAHQPASLGLEPRLPLPAPATPPSFKPRPGTPLQTFQLQRYAPQRRPATSLASVFLWNKTMPMWVLRVPPLARHARGGGVGGSPVALAFPAEAIESRGLLTRLCFGPLDGRDRARVGAESTAGAEAESNSPGPTAGSRPVPPLSAGRPRPSHVSQVSTQAPPSGPTAAGEVAELSLHLWVRGIAPGPLGPIRIPAIVVVQIFVKEPGGAAGREQGLGAQDQCGPCSIPGSALGVLGPPLARPRDAEPVYTHLPGSKGCACGRCKSQR